MSEFANPVQDTPDGSARYTAAILAKLGDRDPFDSMRAMPAALTRAIAGLTPAQIARPEGPGKWSILQVLQHLTDSELVGAYRFRLILAADRPELVGYDQDAWVARLHAGDTDPEDLIARFAALRRGSLRLFEAATPAERERYGIHSERGQESINLLIRLYAGHDLVHLAQLDRIRAAQ